MSLLAVRKSAALAAVALSAYDQDKWSLGTLIKQRTDLSPKCIGPVIPAVFRPVEQSAAIPGIYPHVIHWSDSIDWIFLADNAAAAVTRRVQRYEFNRVTGAVNWRGFITLNSTGTGNITIRSIRAQYEKYTDGTVGVSGTAVTGSGTAWSASRLCVGNRIGFGSTDPAQIVTWYEIGAIGSDTGITLTASAGTIAGGTAYVIEDLRIIDVVTNATTTNGGVWVAKGLRPEIFTSGGTTIALAAATDNLRAHYWLADAATVTNITAAGTGLDAKTDWTNQDLYVLDLVSAGNYKVFKYNVRKALTPTTGKDTTCLILATGNNTFTGTGGQTNNCRLGTLNHGPQSGVKCLYFVSSSRIMAAPVSGITSGATGIIASTMTEVPPGGVLTFTATAAMQAVEIIDSIDRLFVQTTGATAFRSYITQFRTDGGQMDHILTVDDRQINQGGADAGIVPHATTLSLAQTAWAEGGLLYLFGTGTNAATNIGVVLPVGADWQYAITTGQLAITPRLLTPNCVRFAQVYACRDRILGSENLGLSPESIKIYYRTSGISDNSGTWNVVADDNDLSGIAGAAEIQFAFSFRCITDTCAPGRLFGVAVAYEDSTTDSHYRMSNAHCDIGSKYFAWRFAEAFAGTVPTLRIRIYNDLTDALLLDDTTAAAASGTWQKSTDDGASWSAYDTADKTNDITYIRYQPTSMADNIKVRALLTQ